MYHGLQQVLLPGKKWKTNISKTKATQGPIDLLGMQPQQWIQKYYTNVFDAIDVEVTARHVQSNQSKKNK